MLTDETVPAEGARYAAPLVLLPGLWARTQVWRGFATYLAHRGWECRVLDLRGAGGLEARARAVAEYLATLPAPAVLLGHDAGGLVAHEAARQAGAAAVVMVAPLVSGDAATRGLVLNLRSLLGVALGWPVAPPGPEALAPVLAELSPSERVAVTARLGADDGAALRDLVRGRLAPHPGAVPTLVLAGARDPLLPAAAARALADAMGAELQTVADAGHWMLAGAAWQRAVGLVHRWIVQQLGAPLLELYPEAMAEREAEEEEGE